MPTMASLITAFQKVEASDTIGINSRLQEAQVRCRRKYHGENFRTENQHQECEGVPTKSCLVVQVDAAGGTLGST
jgi:hypothetical protein